jgi:hypothetical protein
MVMKPSHTTGISNQQPSSEDVPKQNENSQRSIAKRIGRTDCPWHVDGVCRIDNVTCRPARNNCSAILDKNYLPTRVFFINPVE